DPKLAFAYANVGGIYRELGQFAESVDAFQKALQLLPKHPGIQNDLRVSEQLVIFDRQFAAIRDGTLKPKSPADAMEYASFALKEFKKEYALAFQLYTNAFAADPKLVPTNRYNAA